MKNQRLKFWAISAGIFLGGALLAYEFEPAAYARNSLVTASVIFAILLASPLLRLRIARSRRSGETQIRNAFEIPAVLERNQTLFLLGGIAMILGGFVWLVIGVYLVASDSLGVDAVFVPFVGLILIGSSLVGFRVLLWWFKFMRNGT
jgi:hypothetical protein